MICRQQPCEVCQCAEVSVVYFWPSPTSTAFNLERIWVNETWNKKQTTTDDCLISTLFIGLSYCKKWAVHMKLLKWSCLDCRRLQGEKKKKEKWLIRSGIGFSNLLDTETISLEDTYFSYVKDHNPSIFYSWSDPSWGVICLFSSTVSRDSRETKGKTRQVHEESLSRGLALAAIQTFRFTTGSKIWPQHRDEMGHSINVQEIS